MTTDWTSTLSRFQATLMVNTRTPPRSGRARGQRVRESSRPPCHQRATHSSLDRSPADTHGQHHHGRDLLSPPPPRVPILLRLALGAGDLWSRLASTLPCPAGRSGPWSRRTGAPKTSATRRDRSPPVHGRYTSNRQVGECKGHGRSPRELRNAGQTASAAATQATLQVAGQSSSLPTHSVMILDGSPLFASVDLPALRPPRLAAPARPAPAPGTCEPPARRQPDGGA
jgi:hypothetical protein